MPNDTTKRCTQTWKPLYARFGIDRLVAHQSHEPAHALFVDGGPDQAQVVAQAQYALKIVVGKLLIEQAHEVGVVCTFPTGLVVEAAAGQAQRLATGLNGAVGVGGGLRNQGALLGY